MRTRVQSQKRLPVGTRSWGGSSFHEDQSRRSSSLRSPVLSPGFHRAVPLPVRYHWFAA